jgi:DNA-binding GntR family transcriptional regulator
VTIDHEGDVPVYLQLAAILRGQIERGEIPPRRPLPSINRLAQEYGIARGSAEKAVQVLRDEGRVRTVIGRGVYVVPQDGA